jgi:hypothetical protein
VQCWLHGLGRQIAVLQRLLIAVLFATGIGLLGAGLALLAGGRAALSGPSFPLLGAGIGFLAGACTLYLLCRSAPWLPGWWRWLVALLLGPGVGLLTAGLDLTLSGYDANRQALYSTSGFSTLERQLSYQRKDTLELRAAFLGSGAGLLTSGIIAFWLFLAPSAWKKRLLSAAGFPGPASAMGSWPGQPSARARFSSWSGRSIRAHPGMWAISIFLTMCVILALSFVLHLASEARTADEIRLTWLAGGLWLSLLTALTFWAWAILWRDTQAIIPEQPTPRAEVPAAER